MNEGTVRGVITVVTMVTFLGICWWAYRSANRERFEEDARLPFAEDGGGSGGAAEPEGRGTSRRGGSHE